MVFQSYALYPQMTVRGDLSSSACATRRCRATRSKSAWRARPRCFRSARFWTARPGALSAGSGSGWRSGRRWCAILDVFLFDKPLSQPRRQAALRVAGRDQAAA